MNRLDGKGRCRIKRKSQLESIPINANIGVRGYSFTFNIADFVPETVVLTMEILVDDNPLFAIWKNGQNQLATLYSKRGWYAKTLRGLDFFLTGTNTVAIEWNSDILGPVENRVRRLLLTGMRKPALVPPISIPVDFGFPGDDNNDPIVMQEGIVVPHSQTGVVWYSYTGNLRMIAVTTGVYDAQVALYFQDGVLYKKGPEGFDTYPSYNYLPYGRWYIAVGLSPMNDTAGPDFSVSGPAQNSDIILNLYNQPWMLP